MNIYITDDKYGPFIVDAPICYMHGEPYYNCSFNKQTNLTSPFTTLFVNISVDDTGLELVSSRNVTVNSTANEFVFSLAGLIPRLEPYNLSIIGASGDGNHSYVATTKFYFLPNRSDGGSTVKIDSLFGGLVVQDFKTNSTKWTGLFPYTYYFLWDEWLGASIDDLNLFAVQGYNTIHIVPTGTPRRLRGFRLSILRPRTLSGKSPIPRSLASLVLLWLALQEYHIRVATSQPLKIPTQLSPLVFSRRA
jgi:hypothetical protein